MAVIGLTCHDREIGTSLADSEAHHLLSRTYTDAILESGGIPIVLPAAPVSAVATVLDRIDGLLITGGGDIDPVRYGRENERSSEIDGRRDVWELALVAGARRRGLPTLGICRGCQSVNVVAGGTLHQHVWGTEHHRHLMNEERTRLATDHHDVELSGLLKEIYGTGRRRVNTLHHQSIADLGPGLSVAATAPDGIIEGVAGEDGWPVVAVQWHPERMDPADERPLFDWLISMSGGRGTDATSTQ